MKVSWQAAGATNVGRRRRGNEDAYHTDGERGIFLVADGMGGHAAGEVASELVATTVARALALAHDDGTAGSDLLDVLQRASHEAHEAIVSCCADERRHRGMGTTLTACVVDHAGHCWIGHIGDSRCYRLRAGDLEQVTQDHTWVQREVNAGRLSPDDAGSHPLSHILTRVLSEDLDPEMDLIEEEIEPGDLLLLATDGLYNMVDDPAIGAALSGEAPLAEKADALITAANRGGGADNITVVLIQILPGE